MEKKPSNNEVTWKDPEVCKHFLCGFCPQEIFVNSRVNIGYCDRVHDIELRNKYEKSPEYYNMGYEDAFVKYVETLITEHVENRVKSCIQNNSKVVDGSVFEADPNEEKIRTLTEQILELDEQVETLVAVGREGEANEVTELSTKLKSHRADLLAAKRLRIATPLSEVCGVCGAYFKLTERTVTFCKEHGASAVHTGFTTLRAALPDIKKVLQERALYCRVLVSNLDPKVTVDMLRKHYEQWGKVLDCGIDLHPDTLKPTGHGYVTYSRAQMWLLSQTARPHVLFKRTLIEKRAVPKEPDGQMYNIKCKLHVAKLNVETTATTLRKFYETWGEVIDCIVVKSPTTRQSMCKGYVTYAKEDMVDAAMKVVPHVIDGTSVMPTRVQSSTVSSSSNIPVEPEDQCKIYVSNLKITTNEQSLSDHFGQWGEIQRCKVVRNFKTSESKRFAFITYKQAAMMRAALCAGPHVVDGVTILCKRSIAGNESSPVVPGITKHRVFLAGIMTTLTEQDLSDYFSQFGTVTTAVFGVDYKTYKRKHYAFISFDDSEPVELVLKLQHHIIGGVGCLTSKPTAQQLGLKPRSRTKAAAPDSSVDITQRKRRSTSVDDDSHMSISSDSDDDGTSSTSRECRQPGKDPHEMVNDITDGRRQTAMPVKNERKAESKQIEVANTKSVAPTMVQDSPHTATSNLSPGTTRVDVFRLIDTLVAERYLSVEELGVIIAHLRERRHAQLRQEAAVEAAAREAAARKMLDVTDPETVAKQTHTDLQSKILRMMKGDTSATLGDVPVPVSDAATTSDPILAVKSVLSSIAGTTPPESSRPNTKRSSARPVASAAIDLVSDDAEMSSEAFARQAANISDAERAFLNFISSDRSRQEAELDAILQRRIGASQTGLPRSGAST